MQKPLFLLLSAFTLLATTHVASAPTATPGITACQANELARIRHSVISDELIRLEVTCLKTREADIRQEKRAAKSDGVVTRDERQDIRQDERQTSRAIYRQKYDGQEQWPRTVLR